MTASSLHTEVTVRVTGPQGLIEARSLADGSTLIVGSGPSCGLRIEDHGVSPMHCVLRWFNQQLTVQDWCSDSGTFVNGQRVSEEEIPVAWEIPIQIGDVKLEAFPSTVRSAVQPVLADNEPATEAESNSSCDPEDGDQWPGEAACDVPQESASGPALNDASMRAEDDAKGASADAEDPLPAVPAPSCAPSLSAPPAAWSSTPPVTAETYDIETIAILEEEIEYLQKELALRDEQLASNACGPSIDPVDEIDSGETERLVSRLEELLEELERGDQRARVLEELLHAEQAANRAEQEERAQVETWLADIEQRIMQREAEWQAELSRAKQQIEHLRAVRQQLEAHLHADQPQKEQDRDDTEKRVLQSEVDQLQKQLREAHQCEQDLRRELRERPKLTEPDEIVEEILRKERLKLARERAELSREKADVARRKIEVNSSAGDRISDADARFSAFRQTLKQLHQEEEVKPAVQKQGLGSRLAELWRRLDGPTDTD